MPEEKYVLLPVRYRDGILDYLMERPYKEVAQGIAVLQQAREVSTEDLERLQIAER